MGRAFRDVSQPEAGYVADPVSCANVRYIQGCVSVYPTWPFESSMLPSLRRITPYGLPTLDPSVPPAMKIWASHP